MRLVCTVGTAIVAAVAVATASAEEPPGRFELAPFAAYRFGGEFDEQDGSRDFALDDGKAHGLVFNFRAADEDGQWEAAYGRQRTTVETLEATPPVAGGSTFALDVEYLHFGGRYRFTGTAARPFVAATAGAAHFSPQLPGFGAETYLSASLGGGVDLRADKRLGVRLEGRAFATLLDQDGELFCRADGVVNTCALAIESDLLVQWEARAGVVFRF